MLSNLVQHLSDSDELSSCINTVLPSVVPKLGEEDVDISGAASSTIKKFLVVGRDNSYHTVTHICDTVLPGTVPMVGSPDANVSGAATNIIHEFLKVETVNHII